MLEPVVIHTWITSVLKGDSVLATALGTNLAGMDSRVWEGVAPPGITYPIILFAEVSPGTERRGVGPQSLGISANYLIRVVGQNVGYDTLEAAASRLNELLDAVRGNPASGTIVQSVRESTYLDLEIEAGPVFYRHLGGTYRIWAQRG